MLAMFREASPAQHAVSSVDRYAGGRGTLAVGSSMDAQSWPRFVDFLDFYLRRIAQWNLAPMDPVELRHQAFGGIIGCSPCWR